MLDQFAKKYIEYNKLINKINLDEYYKNTSLISGTFIISLDKDYERYAETLKLINSLNIDDNIIKFPAINGKSLKRSNRLIYHKFSKINPSEIGCFMSHFTLYLSASEHQNQNAYTLIFEDDITLNNNNGGNIKQKIDSALNMDPEMLYLGKCFESCSDMVKINDDLHYGFNPVCFHSYMIKNSFAKQVVNYIINQQYINEPIDNLLAKLIHENKLLVFHPSLFIQNIKWESNLRDKKKQQSNTTECSNIRKIKKIIEHFEINNKKNILKDFVENYVNNLDDVHLLTYYNNTAKYNEPFVVSLEKDSNKYNNTKQLLETLALEPIKIDAIYGKNLDENICDLFTNLSKNEIGCMISHIITIYIISKHKSKEQYSIIFEDDIMFNNKINLNDVILKQKLNDAISYNPNLIYLGKCFESCSNIKQIKDDIYYGNKPLCLHAYMIKNSYAKAIINYIFSQNKFMAPIDVVIPQIANNMNIIDFHPSLFYQNPNYTSNLRGKIAQYYNTLDCEDDRLNVKYNSIFYTIICVIIIIYILKKLIV